MLEVNVYSSTAPVVFTRFASEIGNNSWLKRVKKLRDASKSNEFLRAHLIEENAIAFQLEACSSLADKRGTLHPHDVERNGLLSTLGFMVQVLSMLDGLPAAERDQLRRRVRGALENPSDMVALQHELTVASHFMGRGNRLVWPELEINHAQVSGSKFDLFVEDAGPSGLEIECKAITNDKGRMLHQAEVLAFHAILRRELQPYTNAITTALAVIVTVPDQLPRSPENQKTLARRVRDAVIAAEDVTFEDGTQVGLVEFDIAKMRDVETSPESAGARAIVDSVTDTRNRSVMVMGRRNVGALLVALQSAKRDSLLDQVMDTADKAARQLSGKRPGLIVLGFGGLEAKQLVSIADQDEDAKGPKTLLSHIAHRALASERRQHLIGVAFFSRNETVRVGTGQVSHRGVSYYFHNEKSPFWVPDFKGMLGGS